MEIVVCTDGVDRKKQSGGALGRFLLTPKAPPGPEAGVGPSRAAEVQEVVKRLAGGRARVIVLDRMAGQVYSAAHQQRLGVS